MRRPFAVLVTAVCLLPSGAALAEPPTLQAAIGNPDDFKIAATVRLRYETLDGQPRPGLNESDEQLAIRSTLDLEYHKDGLRIGAQLSDSRAYLGKPGSALSASDVNALEPLQAYVGADLADPFGKGSKASLLLGRFIFNLGSRRFISSDDYRNGTQGYTGARADLKGSDGTAATLFYTLPQMRRPDDFPSLLDNGVALDRESFDLQLWGGLVSRPKTIGAATAELGYYRLIERDMPGRPTRNRNLHTISARIFRDPKPGQWDYEIEGAWQFGHVAASTAANAARLDVDAGMIHANLGYSFPGPAKLRLALAYDYVSGDGPGAKYGRFDTLFGMRRAEFGPSGILSVIGRANISSPSLRVEAAPGKRFDAMAVYRPLWLAEKTDAFSFTNVRDASGKSGSFAGHEIEGRLRYWLVPRTLRLELNFAWIAKGRFLRDAPNAPTTGDTRYLATGFSASF